MKHIKEYLSEGLFDDDEDLLDKSPIIPWFDEHVKFYKFGDEIVPTKEALSVINGKLALTRPLSHVEYYEQPPAGIKYDQKSWRNMWSYICYDVIDQRDIKDVYQDQNCQIINFINKKTQNIILNYCTSFQSHKLKNITCNFNSKIWVDTGDFEQLAEIKFTKYNNQNWISIWGSDLGKELSKEHGRLKTKGFIKKYKDILTKMKNNNVYAFELDNKKSIHLQDFL